MNGNETLIIVLSVIFLPIALIVLFKMPNDRNCNSCHSRLSPYRQKTYHWKINREEKEICQQCYKLQTNPKFPKVRF